MSWNIFPDLYDAPTKFALLAASVAMVTNLDK
jgi:hypothetical protein